MQTAAVLWLAGLVWLNLAGWTLAACHQLNPAAYALALLAGIFLAGAWLKKNPPQFRPQKFFRRFRRPLPFIFLLVTILIFLGGILYAPSNYDALTYRLPRMLNWLAAGRWFWIPTINGRMNIADPAWEWTAMPLLALMRSDRGMFLINALGFLLMPGLLFSIFRRLGVVRRVAWTWMWLLPLAYGFATQAGSIGNDLTGTVLGLLAVHFGLRARRSGRIGDVWCCGLAAALMTGVKVSNLPLVLPCLFAVWPALGLLRKNLAGSFAVAIVAAVISALPTMVLNQVHTGSWNGDPQNEFQMRINNPVAGLAGNGVLLAEQSLVPPLFPVAGKVSGAINRLLPGSLVRQFPRLHGHKINELPGEESAGLGLGITLPLLIVLMVAASGWHRAISIKNIRTLLPPVVLASWVAGVFFMAKIGSEAGPRLMLPYYPLAIVPFLLLTAQSRLLRLRPWRIFLALTALGVLPLLVFSMSRPLWPAVAVTARLAQAHPESKTLQRLAITYAAYSRRNDILAPVRAGVPDEVAEIGFIAGANDTDYSLWRPFGRRKVVDLGFDVSQFLQHPGGVEWVVVKADNWPEISDVPFEKWAQEHDAQIVLTVPIIELVSSGPENWCLLHFGKPAQPDATAR
jgi:hypothetical protein